MNWVIPEVMKSGVVGVWGWMVVGVEGDEILGVDLCYWIGLCSIQWVLELLIGLICDKWVGFGLFMIWGRIIGLAWVIDYWTSLLVWAEKICRYLGSNYERVLGLV